MAARKHRTSGEMRARVGQALRWLGGTMRTGLTAVGLRGACLAALAVGVVWGVGAARARVCRMRRFRVYPSRVRTRAPAWCADGLAAVRFPRSSYSILDPRLTREVAWAYQASPWVRAVRRVEKRFPNGLHVELELRRPAAFVRLPDACYAIDAQAVHLPLDYRRWDHDRRPLPLIFGVKGKPPKPGSRWADHRVTAAAAVLRTLAAEPAVVEQIHVIDVANLEGDIDPLRSEVLLFTRRRVRINWGRPPDTRKFGEPPAAEKLARLRRCLAQPLARAANIDLRFPDDSAVARP